jgi:hypothetical protein
VELEEVTFELSIKQVNYNHPFGLTEKKNNLVIIRNELCLLITSDLFGEYHIFLEHQAAVRISKVQSQKHMVSGLLSSLCHTLHSFCLVQELVFWALRFLNCIPATPGSCSYTVPLFLCATPTSLWSTKAVVPVPGILILSWSYLCQLSIPLCLICQPLSYLCG